MIEDVERRDGVERAPVEPDRRQVAVDELRVGYTLACAAQLLLGEIDTDEPRVSCELAGLACAVATAELDDACLRWERSEELVEPLVAGIVGDLRRPVFPRVGHCVVARGEESRTRIAHSTSTSSSRAAASARSRASRFVS